jgi:hypothetical protein
MPRLLVGAPCQEAAAPDVAVADVDNR